jgi:hypothetical protein
MQLNVMKSSTARREASAKRDALQKSIGIHPGERGLNLAVRQCIPAGSEFIVIAPSPPDPK